MAPRWFGVRTDMVQTTLKHLTDREVADIKWASQFPEELLITALDNSGSNRHMTLHQLGLEEDEVIIREHERRYFYFRRG